MTQPPLSRQLKDLKEELVDLMEKTKAELTISKLNIVATYDLIYNAAQFVKKGFGYVIALDRLINTAGDSNLCFKPLSPTLEAELYIIWKKYQVLSRASSVFLQQLKISQCPLDI